MTETPERSAGRARLLAAGALALLAWAAAPLRAQENTAVDGAKSAPPAHLGRSAPVDPERAPRPEVVASPAGAEMVVDGRLDEPAWAAAAPVGGFVQQSPHTGDPASEPTVVRVLYGPHALYIGAICYQSSRHDIMIAGLEHDFETGAGDLFGVTLDTFLDRRNSFLFLVNPGGAVHDERTFDDSRNVIGAWDGVVRTKVTVSDSAWVVEMAIPLTTLRFDPGRANQRWGIQFLRRIRRANETTYWAPLDRQDVIHRMSKAGTLVGLQGLVQGRNLRVKPYVLARTSSGGEVPAGAAGRSAAAGGDVKYGLTPGMTLDLSYNTDFSQVELDQAQVNLTQYSLFFPERREFFIENAGDFAFGDVSERSYRLGASPHDFTLFHSRRIGLNDDGRPLPILGGGRVSGRAGRFGLGFLDMRTRASADGPAENFAVARVRREILGGSDVGLMLIDREATGEAAGGYNRSWGADANLRLLGHMVVNGYVAGSAAPGTLSDGSAEKLGVAWRDRLWDVSSLVKRVGEHFDPGVGFIRRTAMRQVYGTVGAHPRPAASWVQELNPYVEMDYITGLDGGLETRRATASLGATFMDASYASVSVRDELERIDEPFEIFPGDTVPVGEFTFRTASVSYSSSSARALSASIGLHAGGLYGGRRRSASLSATWRPRYNVYLRLSGERNDVHLPGSAFRADIAGATLRYEWSTRLLGSAFVQYDAASAQLVESARLDFRHAPLSDIYLVYTDRRDTRASALLERSVALKVTRMVGF